MLNTFKYCVAIIALLIPNFSCNEFDPVSSRDEPKAVIFRKFLETDIAQCGTNEVYDSCVSNCPPRRCDIDERLIKCKAPNPDDVDCKAGCRCADNYYRNSKGACVSKEQCDKCFGRNEVYDTCPTSCPPQTCLSIWARFKCNPQAAVCRPSCRCKPGFYRNFQNECISTQECMQCKGPHEYYSCGGACDNECDTITKQNQTNCPYINVKCNEKCYCETGYARNVDNQCIPISECPHEAAIATIPEAIIHPIRSRPRIYNWKEDIDQGNNAFTGKVLSEVVEDNQDTSVVTSPFSILFILSQLALYATGETYDELAQLLNIKGRAEIGIAIPKYLDEIQRQKNVTFALAERVYGNIDYPFSTSFKRDTRNIFRAKAQSLDYSDPEDAADTINTWVASKTNDLIQDLISPSSLSEDTRLVLANAIYFKGNWLTPFDPRRTSKKRFYISENRHIHVKMMNRIGYVNYAYLDYINAKVIELPYQSKNFSFLALLPDVEQDISDLAKNLESLNLKDDIIASLYQEHVNITIPTIDTTTTTDLEDILRKNGVTNIFDMYSSGLNGMLKYPENVYVSTAIQKAKIVINESGSEAAASNAVVMGITAIFAPPRTFLANRPFIYYILFENTPIFAGMFAGNN